MGKNVFDKAFRQYYKTWKFKHPNTTDFKRIMEKESGLELDWFFLDWVGTTRTIDYGIKSALTKDGNTLVTIERIGLMPMPIEVVVSYKDGKKEKYYMPLRIMRGEKKDHGEIPVTVLEKWPWTYPTYTFSIPGTTENIESIEIDPSNRLADVDRSNNIVNIGEVKVTKFD